MACETIRTFFYVFTCFFKIQKTWLYVFWAVAHVFLNTGRNRWLCVSPGREEHVLTMSTTSGELHEERKWLSQLAVPVKIVWRPLIGQRCSPPAELFSALERKNKEHFTNAWNRLLLTLSKLKNAIFAFNCQLLLCHSRTTGCCRSLK